MESNGGEWRRATYRFVRAVDLRLGAPVRNVALPPEPLRSLIRDASLRAWHALLDLTIAHDAAFLVLAGERFADDPPSLRARVALHDGLDRLRAHAIDVLDALPPDVPAIPAVPAVALVEVERDQVVAITPLSIDQLRLLSLEVDVSDCADLAAIRDRLTRALVGATDDAGPQPVLAEAVTHGRLALAPMRDRLTLERELLDALRQAAPPGGWWTGVRDRSAHGEPVFAAPPWDLARIVAAHADALSAPLAGSRFVAQHVAPLLRHWDTESDLAAHRDLMHDAAALAIEVLAAQERG